MAAMANQDPFSVELRPAHLEDWLDALPYADFLKTAQMIEEALRATNRAALKPGQRLVLLELYWRPYRYLLNTLVKGGAQPVLRAAEQLQQRIEGLKRVALELAFGTRLGATEAAGKRSMFGGPTRLPAQARALAARLLSHALILNFHGYAPVPKNLWRELNEIYRQAEDDGTLATEVLEPEEDPPRTASVAGVYVQTAVTALADPYHLPPAAVWEIYEQVRDWTDAVRIGPFREVKNPAGFFVVDLAGAAPPMAYSRMDRTAAGPQHRLLDCAPLQRTVQGLLEHMAAGRTPQGLRLQRPHARMLLEFLQRAWGLPPKRYFPRQEKKGAADLACGYNAAFYFTNGRREFAYVHDETPDTGIEGGEQDGAEAAARYFTERWSFVDEGPGGFAVYSAEKPRSPVRVGELVAVHEADQGDAPWVLGVIRWLMVQRNLAHKIGIQVIAREPEAVAVQALTGDDAETRPRRGFMIADPAATNGFTLITPRGLYGEQRPLAVQLGERRLEFKAGSLRESTAVFDHFSCRT